MLFELVPTLLLFIHAVHSQTTSNSFVEAPTSVNTIVGGAAVFYCQLKPDVQALVEWNINGLSPNESQGQFVYDDGALQRLVICEILHNNTNVSCIAQQLSGNSLTLLGETDRVEILLQGTLQPVINLSRNGSTISWSPPFSLNLTNIEPDIVYCVEVYNITCGRRDLIISDCNVTEARYTFDASSRYIYEYIVTSRSNVPGASNGLPDKVTEQWICLNESQWQWRVSMDKKHLTLNLGVCSSETQSGAPAPSYYELILESLDGLNNNMITNITLERNGEMVDVHIEENIPPNSLWRASILAYGCESDRIVTDYELSTHSIQNVVVHPSLPGQISVTGELIGRSTTGVLIVVYSLTNSSDIHYVAKQVNDNNISLNVTGLIGAKYGVSTFALENGLPLRGVVTSPKNIAVLNSHQDRAQQQLPLVEYDVILRMFASVCITCTFLESSTTNCVAVVHQRISQLNSSGLVNIESSHKFNRSGDTAYGCIEGVNLEQYQVGVIGGKVVTSTVQSNDNGSSRSGAIAGIVLAIMTFILIAVVVIGIIYYYLRRRRWKFIEPGPLYSEVGIAPPRLQSDIVVNIVDDSGFHHYAESAVPLTREEETERDTSAEEQSPPLPPRLEESLIAPPLPPRLEESVILVEDQLLDAGSAGSPHECHNTIKESDRPPPPDQDTSKNGSSDPTYAQPELTNKVAVPPPAATERLVYEDIHGFQNQQGQVYTLPQLPASKKVVDDLHQVVYSEIQPKTQGGATSTVPDHTAEQACEIGIPPPLQPLTVRQLYYHLLSLSSKWLSLGVALLIDKGQLDEVSRNNETDETRLLKMLELYMMRSGHNYSWEEIYSVEKKVKEETVDLNQGGCAQKESGKEQAETMESLDNISPDCHTPYVHGDGSELQSCSSSILDNNTSGANDTQLHMGDNTNNPLTSTPMNKTDAKKVSFSSSRIPPPELDDNSGSVQPEAHDTGLEKIYVNGTAIDNHDTSLEPSSQGKTYNVIEDDGTPTTEVSDDVAVTDLSHGNAHESCAKKLDIKKASESGYVTFDADNSTADVEECSSVNVDHSDDTGSEFKEPMVPEPTSTFVNPSVKSQAMEEQSEGGSVSVYSLSKEAHAAELKDRCSYEPFSNYFENRPAHLQDAGEHPSGDNKLGKDTKNEVHVPDTLD